jgi:hypothetical protein
MQARNDNASRVSIQTLAARISRRESFRRGYNSVMRNEPYDYDIADTPEAVNYARGRSFAIWSQVNKWKGCVWKDGVLSKAAEERVVSAIRDRAII